MITGILKSQIDSIWDVFWSGGIANPADVIEQMTYLLLLPRRETKWTVTRYGLFDLQPGLPTYSRGLADAVADGFLVPPRAISVPLKFQREGIKYDDLSEDEKEQWDALEWTEDGGVPDHVEPEALNKWLFNTDTVDKVLQHLMENGLSVAGGDRLGKTIVFAKGKDHARFIEERFNVHYPHLRGRFARVIDHYEPYAQSLLDDFSNADKPPHIAISVDMLDTGIDIPEVVNLVFFKLVRSKTKFFQMVGRGTRLRNNLFGPGLHKEFFYLFDYCQNLEFFGQNPRGVEGRGQVPLGALVFRTRLDLHQALGDAPADDSGLRTLRTEVGQTLQAQIAAMNVTNFLVRPKRRIVERFVDPKAWSAPAADDYGLLYRDVATLPSEQPQEDETAKRFDLLMLKVQLSVLQHGSDFVRLREQVREIAARIAEKNAIPMVAAQLPLLLDMSREEWWSDVTLPILESVRKRLRDLVKFIDKAERKIVYSNFEDQIGAPHIRELAGLASAIDEEAYRRKMQRFLHAHLSNVAVHKLRTNRPLTAADLEELERLLFDTGNVGTRQEFEVVAGAYTSLPMFIRRLIGLDRQAAMEAFAEFLDQSRFTAEQIRFVNLIIDYLTQNGVMPAERLWQSPYTDFHPAGVDGVLGNAADRIVGILQDVERNAGEPSAA